MRLVSVALLFASLVHGGCTVDDDVGPVGPSQESSASSRRVIRPDGFPADRPYSFGVQAGDTLFLSGQLGRHPTTGEQPEGIAAQTRLAMENLGAVLEAAGMDHRHLVKCHVYLASMDDYRGMNQVYGSFFQERVPARTTVEAAGLPRGAGVEIACIAFADVSRISVVQPPKGSLPGPLGPYSPAVWAGDTLYLSGMGGELPQDRRVPEKLGEQVTQTLANIRTTLQAAGVSVAEVVSGNVYVTRPQEAGELPGAFTSSLGSVVPPPGGVMFLPRLPGPIKTEITFVAVRPSAPRRIVPGANGSDGSPRGIRAGSVLYTRTEAAPDAGPALEVQFRAVLERLRQTVQEAGMQWRDVAHVQVYLTDLADMATMDRVFRETFPQQPPARTTIQVQPAGTARVQVSLVAAR